MNKSIKEWVFNLVGFVVTNLLAFFIGYNFHNTEMLASLIILGLTLVAVVGCMIWTGRISVVKDDK